MGYSLNGVCYSTPDAALAAFQADYPLFAITQMFYLVVPPTITPTGLLTYQLSGRSAITGVQQYNGAVVNLQLPTCASESLDQYPMQDVVFIAALVICMFLGYQTGMHR